MRSARRRGLTLLELLVAMSISAMIAYFAFDLLRDEGKNYSRTRGKIRLQAETRDAVRVIAEDMKNVGYSAGLDLDSTGATPRSRFRAAILDCNDMLPPEQRIQVFDNQTNGQDSLVIRFYEPDFAAKGSTVACRDAAGSKVTPSTISYFYRKPAGSSFGELVRSYIPSGATSGSTSRVLTDIVAFQSRQGQDTALDRKVPVHVPGGHPDLSTTAGWTGDFGLSADFATSIVPATISFSHWTTTARWAQSPSITLPRRKSLRVSYTFRADATFMKAYVADPTKSDLKIGLQDAGGWLPGTVQTIRLPDVSSPILLRLHFNLETSWDNDTTVQLRLEGKTSVDAPTAKVSLQNLEVKVTRDPGVSASNYVWNDGTGSSDSAASRQIGAVRIWLLARSNRPNQEGAQNDFRNIGNWLPSTGTGWIPNDKNSYTLAQNSILVVNRAP